MQLSTRKESRKEENHFNTILDAIAFAISVESGEKSRFIRGRILAENRSLASYRFSEGAPRREILYIIHADMWMCSTAAAADGRALF